MLFISGLTLSQKGDLLFCLGVVFACYRRATLSMVLKKYTHINLLICRWKRRRSIRLSFKKEIYPDSLLMNSLRGRCCTQPVNNAWNWIGARQPFPAFKITSDDFL